MYESEVCHFMELGLFLEGLRDALIERGIPAEAAAKHAAALGRTFSEEDLAEIRQIQSPAEIGEIADSIAAILYKNKNKSAQRPAGTAQPGQASTPAPQPPTPRQPPHPVPADSSQESGVLRSAPPTRQEPSPEPPARYAQNSADFFASPAGEDKTPRGVATFWGLFILTLPLTIAVLAAVLVLFGAVFLSLILAIIGLVVGMIAVVAAGSGLALVGIIYGITQLFTFVAAGVYEIGLGVMIIGLALFGGVVLYNLAIRFLPWVMSWLTVLFTFVFGRFRNLFYLVRRECYKL